MNTTGRQFHIGKLFDVLNKQAQYLPGKTEDFIHKLNELYSQLPQLIREHGAKCLLLVNMAQESFTLQPGIINKEHEPVIFFEGYDFNYNDGQAFGQESYDMEIAEHPTEDMFWLLRHETLDKVFFNWILEAVWNSDLMKVDIPIMYCPTYDLDTYIDLRTGHEDFLDFLNP